MNSFRPYELIDHAERVVLKNYFRLLRFPRFATLVQRMLQPYSLRREKYLNKFFRSAFLIVGAGMLHQEDYRALRDGVHLVLDYLKISRNRRGVDRRPVAWVGWCVSQEIFRAFDIDIVVPEVLSVVGSFKGQDSIAEMLTRAEAYGIPQESCSASKVAAAAYLENQVPKPDFIVGSSHPCDSGVSAYPTLQYLTSSPLFILDTPYWDDSDSYVYYEQNIREMISFIEEQMDAELDWEKLRIACEEENETNFYLQELTEMGRLRPCPMTVELLLLGWMFKLTGVGSPYLTKTVKAFYENACRRIDQGKGYHKRENIRIIWWDVPIAFANLFPWLEKQFGAITVADFIGRVHTPYIDTSSKESIIRDLAKAHLHVAMARNTRGPYEFITAEFERLIEEYSPDCCIFVGHTGCKHGAAASRIKRDICRRAKLPALFMNSDIMDNRMASEASIQRQIGDFFYSHGLVR